MASPDIYSRTRGRDFTDTKNPLDKTVGEFETDDAVRPTLRPWGWFPFLYESPGTFDIGDAGIFWPGPGDYPLPSIDLWQFPNAGQFAEVQQAPTAPADLVSSLCTDQTLANTTMQGICSTLAALDGCTWLDIIAKSTVGGADAIIEANVQFPNGKKVDWESLGPFCLSGNVWELRATVKNPDGSTVLCLRRYFDPPQGGDGVECTGLTASANYEKARDVVIACIEGQGMGC